MFTARPLLRVEHPPPQLEVLTEIRWKLRTHYTLVHYPPPRPSTNTQTPTYPKYLLWTSKTKFVSYSNRSKAWFVCKKSRLEKWELYCTTSPRNSSNLQLLPWESALLSRSTHRPTPYLRGDPRTLQLRLAERCKEQWNQATSAGAALAPALALVGDIPDKAHDRRLDHHAPGTTRPLTSPKSSTMGSPLRTRHGKSCSRGTSISTAITGRLSVLR
jgi:hypothetical protein